MGGGSKREYLAAIMGRYQRAGRRCKQQILDEFCKVCGYHRKHAIRLLSGKAHKRAGSRGRKRQYGEEARIVLERIWLVANRLCSKLLKAALPIWLPFYGRRYGLPPSVQQCLLRISPATIDRLLKPTRRRYGRHGRCGTRPGTLLKHQIPIQTEHGDVRKPGMMEADTVAHCGDRLEGEFIWSLTMTDIFSGWTENRAVWNKGYEGVKVAIHQIEEELPFPLCGFHCDNGGEFLNYHLFRYFSERQLPVRFTRSRPRQRNDTAHVEQKNWTHVRQLLGYQRIEAQALIPAINELYRTWGLFQNFFCPTLKLLSKSKTGSRYTKRYEPPQTPYQRLMQSTDVTELQKTSLTEIFCNLNPFSLKCQIEHKQGVVLRQLR